MKKKRFSKSFFSKDALTVAEDLLGHYLIRIINGKRVAGIIVETEAYCGAIDKGCHAFGNKKTDRTEPMFMEAGISYIYLIYGLNNCLNVVTDKIDSPHAVLIRAVEPVEGLNIVKTNRPKIKKTEDLTNGPGKLCKAFDIDRSLNKLDMINGHTLFIEKNPEMPDFKVISAKRVGIDYAEEFKDKLWRKYISGNPFVSRR